VNGAHEDLEAASHCSDGAFFDNRDVASV
jgi:hypothetical protein